MKTIELNQTSATRSDPGRLMGRVIGLIREERERNGPKTEVQNTSELEVATDNVIGEFNTVFYDSEEQASKARADEARLKIASIHNLQTAAV
jgi:hypothetical protein